MRTCYLAGPICGCDKSEANDWRVYATAKLAAHHIVGVSPLRCEPLVDARYGFTYDDPRFGTDRAIAAKNMFDLRACDATLVYIPHKLSAARPAYGSAGELMMAHIIGKYTALVTDDPHLRSHPLVRMSAGPILTTLDEGLEAVIGLLGAYARPA